MSTKVKLVSLISAFVVVLAIMMVAVMAVPTVTLNIGGNISFTATDLQVTISDGVLANGTVEDSANKMQGVKIDAYNDGAAELATWTNLNLTFNESGEDMTITFTITNNSTVDDVMATVTVNQGTTNNATVSVTTPSSSNAIIPANDGSQQFVITFHVNNRNDSASIENFEINIDLEKYVPPVVYDYFDFIENSDGKTVTLADFDESLADSTDIVIPETVSLVDNVWMSGDDYIVTSIEYEAFYDCSSLTSISLPSSLTSISDEAFRYCTSLTEVDLSNCTSLTSIEYYAFSDCISLTSITLPSSLTYIGEGTFYNCSGLIEIDLSNCTSLTFFGVIAFGSCPNLEELDLSNCTNLTSIGYMAFGYCIGLDSIILPSSLKNIGEYAFQDCTSLTKVDLSNCTSLTSIESYTFSNCSELTSITLPSNLTSIGSQAFSNCSGLTSIILPSSLTTIGRYAFMGCDGLTSVTINQYVFEYVTSSSSSCGYILGYIDSGETVLVPANLIDELLLTNEYLDNSGAFTRSATAVDGYYVYTKI